MALFIPVIAGENHAARAIAAGRAILAAVERGGLGSKGLMVGAGVHTGEAFVGVVGSDEKVDFTALGDTVNIAARLGGLAGPGELLVEPGSLGPRRPRVAAGGARGRYRRTDGHPDGRRGWRAGRRGPPLTGVACEGLERATPGPVKGRASVQVSARGPT